MMKRLGIEVLNLNLKDDISFNMHALSI